MKQDISSNFTGGHFLFPVHAAYKKNKAATVCNNLNYLIQFICLALATPSGSVFLEMNNAKKE